MQQATIYVGHDTSFTVTVQDAAGDLVDFPSVFAITRAKLIFAGTIFDSDTDASIFDWTTNGANGDIAIDLTGYTIKKGTYGARLVGYSATYGNGTVLCTFQIVVDEEITGADPTTTGDMAAHIAATTAHGRSISRDNADHATDGTGEDDLASVALAAGAMGTTGGIRVTAAFTVAGTNDTKTLKFYFGTTAIAFTALTSAQVFDVVVEVTVFNTAANAQRIAWIAKIGGASAAVECGYDTAAIDTSGATTVKFTGECANAGDTITQKMMALEMLP